MEDYANNENLAQVADIEVTAVEPGRTQLQMRGNGADRSDYRIEIRTSVPMDRTTRNVVGELLAQSDIRVWRSIKSPIKSARTRLKRPTSTAK